MKKEKDQPTDLIYYSDSYVIFFDVALSTEWNKTHSSEHLIPDEEKSKNICEVMEKWLGATFFNVNIVNGKLQVTPKNQGLVDSKTQGLEAIVVPDVYYVIMVPQDPPKGKRTTQTCLKWIQLAPKKSLSKLLGDEIDRIVLSQQDPPQISKGTKCPLQ